MLVWIKNPEQIPLEDNRADIPWQNREAAFRNYHLQKSDKNALPIHDNASSIEQTNSCKVLKITHPADAFALSLREYIQTIIPALECRMDVQSSDGHSLLLRYVSSYVSKAHGAYKSDDLYTSHLSSYQAAYRHLTEMMPLEPEMWMSLSSKKISWTPHKTKKFAVPLPNTIGRSNLLNFTGLDHSPWRNFLYCNG